jgi:hypothetical protein
VVTASVYIYNRKAWLELCPGFLGGGSSLQKSFGCSGNDHCFGPPVQWPLHLLNGGFRGDPCSSARNLEVFPFESLEVLVRAQLIRLF